MAEAGGGRGAALPARLREELQCPVCYEPFRGAVTLRCGHNFCRECVCQAWQQRQGGQAAARALGLCPVCKAACKAEAGDLLPTNHTLANLVEMVLRHQEEEEEEGRRAAASGGGGDGGGPALLRCPRHGQRATLFCLDDKEPACALCQSHEHLHAGHKVKALAEAAATYRAMCKDMENSLRDKMKQFEKVQSDYRLIASHNETESTCLDKEIKRQFEELHEFLQNEERAILGQLQEETQKKQSLIEDKIKKLSDESNILLQEIGQLQADMEEEDISFLKKHKSRKRRIAWTIEQPEAIPQGMLVEVTKYLDCLQYKAWKKMVDIIKVVPFSFDPNTASSWLEVSHDLTSISPSTYKLMVGVPERFFTRMPGVLGSKSYSKGFHSWEVDISGIEYWHIGVARKPCGHYWSVGSDYFLGLSYMQGLKSKNSPPPQPIQSGKVSGNSPRGLKRVRVELDCDEGQLSFYDVEAKSHIFSFHDLFGEVFPYFSFGSLNTVAHAVREPLRICPLSVRITEDHPN